MKSTPARLASIGSWGRWVCCLLAAGLGAFTNAQTNPAVVLRTAEAVRQLSPEQAGQHLPVRLRGVVTFNDGALYSRFIQDDTAGIYFQDYGGMPDLKAGQQVELVGVTSPGEYAPVVVPSEIRILGEQKFPEPQMVSMEELVSGKEDSQFVHASGIVRAVRFEEESHNYLVDLVTGGERLTIYTKTLPVPEPENLVDSVVQVNGVCSTMFNRSRQLFGIHLLVPRASDLIVEQAAPAKPFDIAAQSISSLLQFTPQGNYSHRVKVRGTVIYHEPGVALFIQDAKEGLYAQTRQRTFVQPGDQVEVLGFVAKGEYTPMLQDAVYRRLSRGTPPPAEPVDVDEALKGTHDCRLVSLRGRLLDRGERGREQFLVIEAGGFVVHAYYTSQGDTGEEFRQLQNGSEVAVTGVCLIERGSSWRAGEGWRAKSFRLLLRSPADVELLQRPPWWTLQRLLWIVGILAVVVLGAVAWVLVLRRKVQQQTGIIRQQLQMEATLKERYQDLFENANDMVFTHDLTGRLTSINKIGERLLRRPRAELVSLNLLDLVAEDQRAAARTWLEQIVRGEELPTAEWDFLNAAGQRVKLDISSRLIEQAGKPREVEGVARDITERRRLERELLEISNREQRRIGHDLHDGVCQQLAAIAFLVDILGDDLREQALPQSAEAEKIGTLINEATAQARSVARGLFPVRLEENGLVSALEELAESAGSRFKMRCQFLCNAPPSAVDNEVALHLYYIAQEALLNAVKHGGAEEVTMSLRPHADGYLLSVRDRGTGFQMAGAGTLGMGIRIMRYRAKVIGATLDIASQPGQGTEVICYFHLATHEPDPESTHG
ncbi:MAG TPA: PAS domain S-box protein [Verrucomicrobiae bacterium]|nr:PAS domain S-box protein [Verrucomicrobiae bacterium]